MYDIEKIKSDLESSLSEYRYSHSLGVALEAKRLARVYGVDEESAYMAGLLHDVAKEFSDEENVYWLSKRKRNMGFLDNQYKKTVHAEVGAIVAEIKYHVSEEICQAIRYHTLGDKNMTMLDKIIFVADKIEGGKNYPGIEEERILAYQDIDKCLILCLQNQKEKLEREGRIFYKSASDLLEYLLDEIKS